MTGEPYVPEMPEASSEVAECPTCGAVDWTLVFRIPDGASTISQALMGYECSCGTYMSKNGDLIETTASKGEN
jgi:hypothetical protein